MRLALIFCKMNVKKEAIPLPQSGASTEIPGPYLSPEQTESFPLNSKSSHGRIGAFVCCCFWSCYRASKSNTNNSASGLRPVVACFFTFSIALTVALVLQMRLGEPQVTPQGSVASDSRECSHIGASILKNGGNAVDAAVATTICLGVILPHITGLGGGGFMAIYDHRRHHVVDAIDFSVQAPFHTNVTGDSEAGQSVGIPGLLKGLALAHQLYGQLSWAELIMPSVDLCKSGFLVPSNMITALNQLMPNKKSDASSLFWSHFEGMEAGHDIQNLQMAATLQDVADFGSQALYNGSLTDDLIESVAASGGSVTRPDLENYQPIRRKMLRVPFGPLSWVYSVGSPSGGPLLLSALRLLDEPASSLSDQLSTAKLEDPNEATMGNVSVDATTTTTEPSDHSGKKTTVTETSSDPMVRGDHVSVHVKDTFGKATVMPFKLRPKREKISEQDGEEELASLLETMRDASLLHSLLGARDEFNLTKDDSEIIMNPAEALKELKNLNLQHRLRQMGGHDSLRPSGTNVAVIDSNELYVSVVSGLGSLFGSQILTSKGYLLNSALSSAERGIIPESTSPIASLSVDKSKDLLWKGEILKEGGRPLSSSAVAFVVPRKGRSEGKANSPEDIDACGQRIVIGSADALSLLQVLVNILLKGSSLVEGIEFQRVKPLAFPASYGIEVGLESSKLAGKDISDPKGISGTPLPIPYVSVNGIQEIGDTLASHSDSRGGGVAARF